MWVMKVGATHDSSPNRPTHPEPSTSGGEAGVPEPLPISSLPPWAVAARSAMVTLLVGEPFTRTVLSASSRSSRDASRASSASSSSWSRTSVAASITARPLLNVVWLPEAPPSHGPASVS